MTLMPEPQHKPKRWLTPSPNSTPGSLFKAEWRHLADLEPLRFCLLLLPSMLLLAFSPLLPITAYALWFWAAHSWAWHDRWASIWTWTKQGGTIVALVFVIAVLSSARIWMFSQVTALVQTFWRAHFGGDLSLWSSDLDGFVARTLLLLPLAPALALLYEWLDPQTSVHPRRILTPTDLAEPKPSTNASHTASSTAQLEPPPMSERKMHVPKARSTTATQRQGPRKRKSAQQTTIEGFLTTESTTASQPSRSSGLSQRKPEKNTSVLPSPPTEPIDWDDLAE